MMSVLIIESFTLLSAPDEWLLKSTSLLDHVGAGQISFANSEAEGAASGATVYTSQSQIGIFRLAVLL